MPRPWSALLAVLVVLHSALPASAQVHPQIETVLVGLPAGSGNQESGRYRPGAWTPVYLKIKAGKEGNPRDAYRLLLESADAEQTAYNYPVTLPALAAGQDHIAIGYLRPGTNLRELNVTLLTQDGKTVQSTSRAARDGGSDMVAPQALLAVAVGARLNNLRSALDMVRTGQKKPAAKPGKEVPLQGGGKIPEDLLPDQGMEDDPDDAGSRRFAYLERVEQLPDRWFGYESADVLVLVTGNKEFTTQLLEDQTGRCQALLEWVRRGGRLILSVSSNHQLVSELLDKKLPLLDDCPIKGSLPIPQLNNLQNWVGGEGVLKKVEVAQLQPSERVHVILQEQSGGKARPVIVQGSCGLGRVVLVGFDLDVAPFTTWNEKSRRKFWDQLLQEVLQQPLKEFQGEADNLAPRGGLPVMAKGLGNAPQPSVDLLTTLQRDLETFDELPVINFAWVTLFILIYILLVGPLDYFVLKKLFKRLELTWITFPSLVLLVSFLAYLIAYRSKGDDLHVNKIDLVEYDLEGNQAQAYGTSWFTVFSPRVQRYTLADQPAAPHWAAPQPKEQPPGLGTMLTTLTGTESLQRINPPALFPQPYAYAEDAVGIENLAIPVWSMRTFTSSWRRPLPSAAPGIEANIDRGRTPRPLPRGNIINHLPVDLESVTLFYGGKLYVLGTLAAGEERSIDALFDDPKKELDRTEWLREHWLPGNAQQQGGNNFAQQFHEATSYTLMKRILFNGEGDQRSRNAGLRNLDQTWRIRPQVQVPPSQAVYRPEIILVARVAPQWGKAEAINSDAAAATRLWLGQLAGPGAPPPLPGVSRQ